MVTATHGHHWNTKSCCTTAERPGIRHEKKSVRSTSLIDQCLDTLMDRISMGSPVQRICWMSPWLNCRSPMGPLIRHRSTSSHGAHEITELAERRLRHAGGAVPLAQGEVTAVVVVLVEAGDAGFAQSVEQDRLHRVTAEILGIDLIE